MKVKKSLRPEEFSVECDLFSKRSSAGTDAEVPEMTWPKAIGFTHHIATKLEDSCFWTEHMLFQVWKVAFLVNNRALLISKVVLLVGESGLTAAPPLPEHGRCFGLRLNTDCRPLKTTRQNPEPA
jgi:hypothetical protein